MFERYTEKARRTIFFARYEASRFASGQIETEHLLLRLFRENKTLIQYFSRGTEYEFIEKELFPQAPVKPPIPTSVDLPLSDESKRVLNRRRS
jgi:ATP-dependent Clp protease ATP-binding subunit ClpC